MSNCIQSLCETIDSLSPRDINSEDYLRCIEFLKTDGYDLDKVYDLFQPFIKNVIQQVLDNEKSSIDKTKISNIIGSGYIYSAKSLESDPADEASDSTGYILVAICMENSKNLQGDYFLFITLNDKDVVLALKELGINFNSYLNDIAMLFSYCSRRFYEKEIRDVNK